MKYMLDTNICIHILKRQPPQVLEKFNALIRDEVCISSVTYAELMFGVQKSGDPDRNRLALIVFLAEVAILPFDESAAEAYGSVRTELERLGTPIGPLDTMIAAHALSRKLTVVTNNTREFQRVHGLSLENWVR